MAWFITSGCEQQSVSFPTLLIGNKGVIENLEESRPENQKIETITSFFFRLHLAMLWIIPFVFEYFSGVFLLWLSVPPVCQLDSSDLHSGDFDS